MTTSWIQLAYAHLAVVERWLGSSAMSQQVKYHATLRGLRADRACDFLLEDASFINWYRASSSEHLVLLGKMGSGKTVAMGFLVDELRRMGEQQLPQAKVCVYYCQDGEPDQAVQILSCLILSLLAQFADLKKSFYEWYTQAQRSGDVAPSANTEKLQEFLQRLLEAIDRQVFFVIDGFDGCDWASRAVVLKCFETLSQNMPRLKVLLSFRPEEEIIEQVGGMSKITLRCDAKRDGIIVRKAVETQLSHLSKDVKALVIERVSHMAQGSAIWTKMVIELIQTRDIMALGPMRQFLEQVPLPSNLSAHYTTVLSRCTSNDPENELLANKALEILAVASRPFSILEFAWEVAMETAPPEVTTSDWVDHQRLMWLIHPFLGLLDFNDLEKRQVRLIHHSVKAFIVEHRVDQVQSPATSALTDRANLQ